MEDIHTGIHALFILLGAIMILAMHAGFAFLELGTVREKNQVNFPLPQVKKTQTVSQCLWRWVVLNPRGAGDPPPKSISHFETVSQSPGGGGSW